VYKIICNKTFNLNNFNNFLALLFSATFPKKVEALAREVTTEPVRISIGYVGQVHKNYFINRSLVFILSNNINKFNYHFKANADITQVIEILADDGFKWDWLITRLASFCVGKYQVFIFCLKSSIKYTQNLLFFDIK
jgi:ATP-dependent RNA helicase DDX42